MQDLSSIPTSQPKQDFWDQNNKLKPLLLVLIFVFLISGIFLVALTVWQNNYRQKVYEETKANLPVHKEVESVNQPISTSEWETYKNNEYGFEIKYPMDWETVKSKNELQIRACFKKKNEKVYDNEGLEIECRIAIYVVSIDRSLDEIRKQTNLYEDGSITDIVVSSDIPALYIKRFFGSQVDFIKDKKLFSIGLPQVKDQNQEIFESMVKSFKFIK